MIFGSGVWRISSLGNKKRTDPCLERQQVCGNVGLQRGHHVCAGGSGQLCTERGPERQLYYHLCLHHFLHNWNTLLSICSQGWIFYK